MNDMINNMKTNAIEINEEELRDKYFSYKSISKNELKINREIDFPFIENYDAKISVNYRRKYIDFYSKFLYETIKNNLYLYQYNQNGIISNKPFKIIDADIFISHSHSDICAVHKFANYITNKFGYTCFVDFDVWENKEKVINNIEKVLYVNHNYSLKKILQFARDNVDILLVVALTKQMQNAKNILLFSTKNYYRYVNNSKITRSPWIYYEVDCAKNILDFQEGKYIYSSELLSGYSINNLFNKSSLNNYLDWLNSCRKNGYNLNSIEAFNDYEKNYKKN